jgi:trehalose 6-phosphate synthase/phosphatase
LIDLLTKLSSDTSSDVVIISGRSAQNLQDWFGHLPVSLVAEHGASIKAAGNRRWQVVEHTNTTWKKSIRPILDKYTALTPRARVETKPHSLVWHYRAAPSYYAQKYAVIIKRALRRPLKDHGLELLQGNKVIEIKNPQVAKGKAAERWLKRTYDFVLAIGDDMTDEELFKVLPPTAYSLKVGRGRTQALYRLGSHRDVLKLLQKLTKA